MGAELTENQIGPSGRRITVNRPCVTSPLKARPAGDSATCNGWPSAVSGTDRFTQIFERIRVGDIQRSQAVFRGPVHPGDPALPIIDDQGIAHRPQCGVQLTGSPLGLGGQVFQASCLVQDNQDGRLIEPRQAADMD